ncbi:MAG: hypothetical protein ACI8WB_001744 [Phenylobacterium sp.]|jgi:hypothetical protein
MTGKGKIKFIGTLVTSILLFGCNSSVQTDAVSVGPAAVFFDDFSYNDMADFYANDWKVRTEMGHPGIAGASWSDKGISFHGGVDGAANGVVRMTSVTGGKGDNTQHTQFCHARKYLEGTYAARVFFRDEPTSGPDGDEVIQTFYAISPLEAPMHPDYSETDFEYLPNGGWGANEQPAMWSTTWETFQLKPWTKVNEYTRKQGSYSGWHTLVLTVSNNRVTYYVDGELLSVHGSKVAPEVHMSMNFNLWFMPKGADGSNGPIDSPKLRQYQQDIDWVFHQAGEVLSTAQVEDSVRDFRGNKVRHIDDVVPQNPALPSPCGL